jgi:hypothetical protein
MIEIVKMGEIIASARHDLGLPAGTEVDSAYWFAGLRRLAGQLCPCSPRTLVSSMAGSHRALALEMADLADQLEDCVDALVAVGDLLEFHDVTTLDEKVKATWVFAAPPSFVMHPSGAAYILGMAPDDALPLPIAWRERVVTRGPARVLEPLPGEDLEGLLKSSGFWPLSLNAWMRSPKPESAASIIAGLDAKLATLGPAGHVPDLKIFDWTKDTRSYRARWVAPSGQDGYYIVRRPQAYGADLWGYASLERGEVRKLVDFPVPGSRYRGCDMAWRVQLAIDALLNRPQRYRVVALDGGRRFDMFFPLPDWARRRLSTIGQEIASDKCLMSFSIPLNAVMAEQAFLKEYLFLESEE